MYKSKLQVLMTTSLATLLFFIGHCGYNYKSNKFQGKMQQQEVDPFVIVTSTLPSDHRFNPTVSNGYLGHRIYSDTIFKNGLYNGKMGDSHRARIPTTLPFMVHKDTQFTTEDGTVEEIFVKKLYVQNMKLGTYSATYEFKSKKSGEMLCSASQIFYAHKFLTRLLVTEISIHFNVKGKLFLSLKNHSGEPTKDIEFEYESDKNTDMQRSVNVACGNTIIPEAEGYDTLPVCYFARKFSNNITVTGNLGENFSYPFITSIAETSNEAQKFYKLGVEMQMQGVLLSTHIREWEETWSYGSMILKGQSATQTHSIVSSLYYLLSAFPPLSFSKYPFEFFGVSPGGLTNGGENEDYLGHVFWDQDFWMLPALLPLFPDLVRMGLEYRVARLETAENKAKNLGFTGAMYPWESAYSGIDVCPGDTYIKYEQHVTGDLIHILRQYIYLTGNWEFLVIKVPTSPKSTTTSIFREYVTPWDMVNSTAVFWVSRAEFDDSRQTYLINNVMGPDEYHAPVNNSAFTNVVASQNIRFAIEAAKKLNIKLPELDKWEKITENLDIPYDKNLDYHPEFNDFDCNSDTVKQADTIMLGFPLKYQGLTKKSQKNDLKIYGNITDPNGPAMTWSMFSVNWNSLDHYSLADEYFLRQYSNIQIPFQIWAEQSSGEGAVNFLTGIGGYLQSILYGYLGLRINRDHIIINPRLLPGLEDNSISNLRISGIKFRSLVIDFEVKNDNYLIILAGYASDKHHSNLLIKTKEKSYELSKIDDFVTIPNLDSSKITIYK